MNFSENKGRAGELLAMIDDAIDKGIDVTLDTYPYLPGCTTLAALLPSWASSGGPAETLKRLEDPETVEKIRVAVEETGCDGGHGIPTNWDEIQVGSASHPDLQAYSGRRISEIAKDVGKTSAEVFFDILRKDNLATSCLMHIGDEDNVREIMQHRVHMSGSDAILHGKTLHPRAYGTFTRYIGEPPSSLSSFPVPFFLTLTCLANKCRPLRARPRPVQHPRHHLAPHVAARQALVGLPSPGEDRRGLGSGSRAVRPGDHHGHGDL